MARQILVFRITSCVFFFCPPSAVRRVVYDCASLRKLACLSELSRNAHNIHSSYARAPLLCWHNKHVCAAYARLHIPKREDHCHTTTLIRPTWPTTTTAASDHFQAALLSTLSTSERKIRSVRLFVHGQHIRAVYHPSGYTDKCRNMCTLCTYVRTRISRGRIVYALRRT